MNEMDFIKLIKESVEIYKKAFVGLLKVTLLGCLGAFVYVLGLGVIAGLGVVLHINSLFGIPYFVAGVIFLIALLTWTRLAEIKMVDDFGEHGHGFGAKRSFSETRKFIVPFIMTSFLFGIIALGWSLLLIIPGIIIEVWFCFYNFNVVLEKETGFAALFRSREYLRGRTGKVFLYFFAFGILSAMVTSIPQFLLRQANLSFLAVTYNIVMAFIIGPVGLIFSYLVYKAAKKQRGNFKLTVNSSRKIKYLLPLIIILFASLVIIVLNFRA